MLSLLKQASLAVAVLHMMFGISLRNRLLHATASLASKQNILCYSIIDLMKFSDSGQKATFSQNTSTDALRTHLFKFHKEKYIEACAQFGWAPKGQFASLPAETIVPKIMGTEEFTKAGFIARLVKFIVANDQVYKQIQLSMSN